MKCYQSIILIEQVFEEDKKQEEIVTKCVRRWRRNINSSLLQRGQLALCPKGAGAFCFQPFLTFWLRSMRHLFFMIMVFVHLFFFIAKRTGCPLPRDCQCALFFKAFLLFDLCQWDILFYMIMVFAHIFLFIAKKTPCPLPRGGRCFLLSILSYILTAVNETSFSLWSMIMVFIHIFLFIAKRTAALCPEGSLSKCFLTFWSWSMRYFVLYDHGVCSSLRRG